LGKTNLKHISETPYVTQGKARIRVFHKILLYGKKQNLKHNIKIHYETEQELKQIQGNPYRRNPNLKQI